MQCKRIQKNQRMSKQRQDQIRDEFLLQMKSLGEPTHYMTCHPHTLGIADTSADMLFNPNHFTQVLNYSMNETVRDLYGSRWGKHDRLPCVQLFYEHKSNKTIGNRPEELHAHGRVWLPRGCDEFRFQRSFESKFKHHVMKKRDKILVPEILSHPTVLIERYDATRSQSGVPYELKHSGEIFDASSNFIWGRNRDRK